MHKNKAGIPIFTGCLPFFRYFWILYRTVR